MQQVLATLAERVVDGDESVRTALRAFLSSCVLPVLGPDAVRPFMPIIMAHVCGWVTVTVTVTMEQRGHGSACLF